MILPDKFDGKMDWEEFITHFQTVAAWNGWSGEDQAIQLGLSMSGRARSVFTGLPVRVKQDYQKLIAYMGKHFGPAGREAAYKAEFRHRHRAIGEHLQDFADKIMKVSKKAFPRMAVSAREEIVIEQFKLGLMMDLRKHIQFSHPSTLDEVVIAGQEYEAMEEGSKCKKPVSLMGVSNVSEVDTLGKMIEKLALLTEQNTKLLSDLSLKSNPRRDNSQVECYGCHQKGHFRPNCPQNKGVGNVKANLNG